MKKLLVIGCTLVVSCSQLKGDTVKDFIPGMYVREFESEFAKGSDTLILKLENENNYTIMKRSGFSRIKNGVFMEKEYRQELWAGTWHPKDGVMEEFKRGKMLHFNPRENKLLLGASEYIKLNE